MEGRITRSLLARWAGIAAGGAGASGEDGEDEGYDGRLEVELLGVRKLTAQVDARTQAVWDIGHLLPCLQELRLSDSVGLESLRDLGTELAGLRVLWVARCGLQSLDGLGALPRLEELYASYNRVASLSPLVGHDALRVLDVEGNEVEAMHELTVLGTLRCLEEVNLSSNVIRNYRRIVADRAPWVRLLDDEPLVAGGEGEAVVRAEEGEGDGSETWSSASAGERKEDVVGGGGGGDRGEGGEGGGGGGEVGVEREDEREEAWEVGRGVGRALQSARSADGERRRGDAGGWRPQSARVRGGAGGSSAASSLTHGTDVVFAGNPALAFRKQRVERERGGHVSILATLDSIRELDLTTSRRRTAPQLISHPVTSPPRPLTARPSRERSDKDGDGVGSALEEAMLSPDRRRGSVDTASATTSATTTATASATTTATSTPPPLAIAVTTSPGRRAAKPSTPSSPASSASSGAALGWKDEDLVDLLRKKPKTVPELHSRDAFRAFFRGIDRRRMLALLQRAYGASEDGPERIRKRLELLDDCMD